MFKVVNLLSWTTKAPLVYFDMEVDMDYLYEFVYIDVVDEESWKYLSKALSQDLKPNKAYVLSPTLKTYRLDSLADLNDLRTNKRKVVSGNNIYQG